MMQNFFDFGEAERRKKQLENRFEELKNGDRDVYIFGVGEYAEKLKAFLQLKGIAVAGFVVNDHFADKIPGVLPLSKVVSLDNMNLIFGLSCGYSRWFYKKVDQIQKSISKCVNSDFFVISDYWLVKQGELHLNHETFDSFYLKEHFDEFEQTYNLLADDLSKKVMSEYLYTCVCLDASRLAQLGTDSDYE